MVPVLTLPNALDDIQQLVDQGKESEALKQLDARLKAQPDDHAARLLKADLCLTSCNDASFVGLTAQTFFRDGPRDDREQAIIDHTLQWARSKLDEARSELKLRNWSRVERHLRMAMVLAPWDASLHLTVGLILFEELQPGAEEAAESDPVASLRSILNRPGRLDNSSEKAQMTRLMEGAFQKTRELGEAGSLPWLEATHHLAAIYLKQDKAESARRLLLEAQIAGDVVDSHLAEVEQAIFDRLYDNLIDHACQLMRLEMWEQAANPVEAIIRAAPARHDGWLLLAEWLNGKGDVTRTETIYRGIMGYQFPADKNPVDLKTAHQILKQVQIAEMSCPRCAQALGPTDKRCDLCHHPIPTDRLLRDRYEFGKLDPAQVAAVGLVMLLKQQERADEMQQLAADWLPRLPDGHTVHKYLSTIAEERREPPEPPISNYQRQLAEGIQAYRDGNIAEAQQTFSELVELVDWPEVEAPALAWRLLTLDEDNLPDSLPLIRRAGRLPIEVWCELPSGARQRLIRALLKAGMLPEARDLLTVIFTEAQQKTSRVIGLRRRCERLIKAECDRLAAESQQALADGFAEKALNLAQDALKLDGDHIGARLARGWAYLDNETPYIAATDFRSVLDRQSDEAIRVEASLGLARTGEQLGDLPGAIRVLQGLAATADHPAAAHILHHLERRQSGQPALHIQPLDHRVAAGTLRRIPEDRPRYQAVFAIRVQAAARWRADDRLSLPRVEMVRAGYEFVATLGGLAGTLGKPAFELRLIAHPDRENLSRGRVDMALLCRVTHRSPEGAQHLAETLWSQLKPHLPLAGDSIYRYEPVFDEQELTVLLKPFEICGGAELIRREQEPEDGAYVVYPFTSGGTTLSGLMSLMLRRDTDSMLSIHLQPASLSTSEQAAIRENFDRLRRVRIPEDDQIVGKIDTQERSILLPDGQRLSQVEMLGRIGQALDRQPFIMRVTVASAGYDDALLPNAIAVRLFGPDGQYRVIRAVHPDEMAALTRNLVYLEAERWMDNNAPAGLERLPALVSEPEAAWTFRLPMPEVEGLPGLPALDVKASAPARLPAEGLVMGESVALIGGEPAQVRMAQSDRRRHVYIVGKTGVGKSTLVEGMALQDIQEGRGVAVLDPHGDLVESLLARIPPERADDVIVFDPSDLDRPIGLNFLEAETETQRHQVVTEFIQMLMRMYDPKQIGIVGPRFQHNVRNAMLTVMEAAPKATMIELVRVLTDRHYVQELLPNVKDPLVRNYWTNQIANTSDFHKSEILDYIVSKFNRFVGDSRIRNIVGQSHSTLDFRAVMDERKILLVNLSKGKIGSESAEFLGFLLLQSLLSAALSRAEHKQIDRGDFCLYVDEFQTFATESFANMLSEGRKYGLCLVMANQYISQLTDDLRAAVFGNVGTLVSFGVGYHDARVLAPEFYPIFSEDDLINMPRYTAGVRLLVDGMTARPFAMHTRLVPQIPDEVHAGYIKQLSRLRYGCEIDLVREEIDTRFHLAKRG